MSGGELGWSSLEPPPAFGLAARRSRAARGPEEMADGDQTFELDEPALERWGRRLGEAAVRERAFLALQGPLGAGKTRLVQAACRGAGVVEDALSPTFTLVHRYEGKYGPVWHVDLYRIEDPSELVDLAWDDLLAGDAPVFVEWAERAGERLPAARWEVRLAMSGCPDTRRVRVTARGGAPPPPSPGHEAER